MPEMRKKIGLNEPAVSPLQRWTLEEVNQSMVTLLDFDGTLTDGGYPNIGDLNGLMAEFIANIRSLGDKVIIWTCRTSMYLCKTPIRQTEEIRAMARWLHSNMVIVDGILMHDKPICSLYIGDETMNPDQLAISTLLASEDEEDMLGTFGYEKVVGHFFTDNFAQIHSFVRSNR